MRELAEACGVGDDRGGAMRGEEIDDLGEQTLIAEERGVTEFDRGPDAARETSEELAEIAQGGLSAIRRELDKGLSEFWPERLNAREEWIEIAEIKSRPDRSADRRGKLWDETKALARGFPPALESLDGRERVKS